VVGGGKLLEELAASIFNVGPEDDDSTLSWNICTYLPIVRPIFQDILILLTLSVYIKYVSWRF
jgi:hypothetical protein